MNKAVFALACSFGLLAGSQSFAQRDWDNDDRQESQQQQQQRQKQYQDRWSSQNRYDDENRLHGGVAKAKKLIGGDIETTRGEDIGDIEDIVADTQKEKVTCVVVSLTGRGTDSNRYILLPWNVVTPKPGDEDKLTVNVDRETLRNAPGFDKNHWPDFSSNSRILLDSENYLIPRTTSAACRAARDSRTTPDPIRTMTAFSIAGTTSGRSRDDRP